MSIGEDRVRTKFNPSQDSLVDQIKQDAARQIDRLDEMRQTAKNGEQARLISLAMTAYEEAAIWAVKAATA